ncbi:hypothetical protein BC830DRAFT_121700 [Chytriomyces sp. MP71]|nr:hypothetical protein BC830DRAFT_121700 [Chytriomyces sp. MP71]
MTDAHSVLRDDLGGVVKLPISDLFKESTVSRIQTHFKQMSSKMPSGPNARSPTRPFRSKHFLLSPSQNFIDPYHLENFGESFEYALIATLMKYQHHKAWFCATQAAEASGSTSYIVLVCIHYSFGISKLLNLSERLQNSSTDCEPKHHHLTPNPTKSSLLSFPDRNCRSPFCRRKRYWSFPQNHTGW